jgi:ribonucleotide reductase alpha subunit
MAGEFVCVSRHLLQDLIELGLWTPELKNKIIVKNGSIAQIEEIPAHIRALYKTVWEISQKTVINMAADRGAYIDQVSPRLHASSCFKGRRPEMCDSL